MKPEKINLVEEAITSRLGKKVKAYKKLYSGRIDGDGSSVFHSKCDTINNTLVLFKTKNGARFGGFTTQTWQPVQGEYKEDKNSFLFSSSLSQNYPIKDPSKSIYCDSTCGPCFGIQCDIAIYNKFLSTTCNVRVTGRESFDLKGIKNPLTENDSNPDTSFNKIEVFQILLDS